MLSELPVDLSAINKKLDLALFERFQYSTFSYWDFGLPILVMILVVIPIFFLDFTLRRSFVELNGYTSRARSKYNDVRTFFIVGLLFTFFLGVAGNIFAAPIVSYLRL